MSPIFRQMRCRSVAAVAIVLGLTACNNCSPNPSDDARHSVDAGEAPPEVAEPAPLDPAALAQAHAHPAGEGVETFEDLEGRLIGVSGRLAVDTQSSDSAEAATRFLEALGAKAWGWTGTGPHVAEYLPEIEAAPAVQLSQTALRGVAAVALVQVHAELPIEDREATVLVGSHSSEPGFVVGGWFGQLGPDPIPHSAPTEPKLTVEAALKGVAADPRVAQYQLDGPNGVPGTWRGRLVYNVEYGGVLAWRVLITLYSEEATLRMLIDATSGALLEAYNEEPTGVEIKETRSLNVAAWKGTSPRAVPGARYRTTFDFNDQWGLVSQVPGGTGAYFVTTNALDPYGVWNPDDLATDAFYAPLRYATDAYEHTGRTLQWAHDTLGWKGWTGSGGTDLRLRPFSTTAWNASASPTGRINLHSGVSSGGNPAGTGLSVIAHEFGHLMLYSANPLAYRNESGALNEALSDLTGNLARGFSSDGLIGDDVDGSATSAIRDMANPPAFGDPDRYSQKRPLAAGPSIDNDYGGVHSNSGIVNKAHWLMLKGSQGAPFNGYEVVPLSANFATSQQILTRLVYSALFAHTFTENATLPEYAAGLYGFCRASDVMWKGFSLTTSEGCGSVHDALAATELMGASTAPTDLVLSVSLAGTDDGKLTGVASVRNRGTARYEGPLRFDLRGTIKPLSTVQLAKATLQPRTTTDFDVAFTLGDLARELPYDMPVTVSAAAGVETHLSNNTVMLRLDANAYVATAGAAARTTLDGKPAMTVSVVRDGNYPLRATDVGSRLLYYRKGTRTFEWGAHPSELKRLSDGSRVPRFTSAPLPLTTEPLRADFASVGTATFETASLDLATPAGVFRQLGVLVFHKDGTIKTTRGTVVDEDLVLVALNYDGRLPVTSASRLLYCLNCDARVWSPSGTPTSADVTLVYFGPDVKLGDHLPADLATAWDGISQNTTLFRRIKFMRPNYGTWLRWPDPVSDPPVSDRGGFVNLLR